MKILDVTPPPTDDEAAAIAAALQQLSKLAKARTWHPRTGNTFDRGDAWDEAAAPAGWRAAARQESIDAGI